MIRNDIKALSAYHVADSTGLIKLDAMENPYLLPDELRETLLLVVVGELTHQETANLLEIPLGTVLSRVSRARKRLREHLMTADTK